MTWAQAGGEGRRTELGLSGENGFACSRERLEMRHDGDGGGWPGGMQGARRAESGRSHTSDQVGLE